MEEKRLTPEEKSRLVNALEKDAKSYEAAMPSVPIGALCTGNFLLRRGYNFLGRERMYQREKAGNKKNIYIFLAVPQVMHETVTAVPLHPIYELEAID